MAMLTEGAFAGFRRCGAIAVSAALLAWGWPTLLLAQDEATEEAVAAPADDLLTADELRVIVAPIAFYPDEVLAIVLPASTTGIEIVQAQRFLEKRKSDPSLEPNADWDPSVIALINYPDIVDRLNADLDWTERLGNAVLDQQSDVMDAIQEARNEAVAAGYLKSDEKQVITQEKETVVIQSADPEVVYVPDYDPDVVVQQTYASYPPPAYYPPYTPYYYPGATFFAGAITGAAFAYAFDWGGDDIDINVNDGGWGGGNNINTGDINIGNQIDSDRFGGDRVRGGDGDKVKWNGNKQRQKRDTASTKRRNNQASPLGKGTADNARQKNQNRAGKANKQRAGEQNRGQRNKSGLGNPQKNRQTAKQSKRGNNSMRDSGGSMKRKQQGGQGMQKQRKQGGSGMFANQGGGNRAGAQRNRGQKSMGSRKPRRRG
jgi:hypothetical protein